MSFPGSALQCSELRQGQEAYRLPSFAGRIACSSHGGQRLERRRQRHLEAAEELYRKALSIAEEQEAKLWQLRATVGLARLRRDQGRPAEGRDLLAPIYGWFSEGFDTADLKEAKALLDELG